MTTSSSVYVLFIDDGGYLPPRRKSVMTVASGTRLTKLDPDVMDKKNVRSDLCNQDTS
jgi:hypothetical protein